MRSALGSGVELRDRLVLGAASAVLVVLAWRSSAEFSAHIALDASLRQPLGGLFGRVLLAEPVNGLSFRPLSVLLARAFAFLGDPTSPWPNALKALLVVPFLGIARSWWQQLELGPSRVPLLFVLGVPAVLFNVWHPGEFDLVGAILLLAVDLSLLRARAGSAPTTAVPPAALVAAVAALLLKDSVAVLLLVLLAVRALEAFRVDRHLDSAPARLLAGMSAALFVFFLAQPEWGRMVGPASAAKGSTGVQSGPVVDLAAVPERLLASTSVVFAQLLGLLGVAGALTLAAARLPARGPSGEGSVTR